jgi:predicted lactoylglutathione lyase
MAKMFFLNLPVKDVAASTAFYEAVGATKNPMFSNETTSCMVVSDTIYIMLMSHDRMAGFIDRRVIDPKTEIQALFTLSADSRDDVDQTVERAAAAGGRADINDKDDYGWMYGRSFEDLDGHCFGVNWMDIEAATKAMAPEAQQA